MGSPLLESSSPSGALAELQSLRAGAVMLGLVFPALYFVTRLEDPLGHEPFWQYQACGLLFLTAAAVSLMPGWRARFARVFYAMLFVVAAWACWAIWQGGFAGRRIALGSVLVAASLFITSWRWMAAYLGLLFGALVLGIFATDPVLDRGILLGRVGLGIAFFAVFNGLRAWARERVEQAHRRLRSFVERSPLPILVVLGDECRVANDAAHELLGITPGERLGRYLPGQPPYWLGSRQRGRAVLDLRARDGGVRQCEVAYAPFGEDDEPGLMQLVVLDRTEEEQRLRSKDAVLASTSRELRAPLAAIRAALEVLENPETRLEAASLAEPESRRIVQQARRAREYLERLTDELTLARSHPPQPSPGTDEQRVLSAADLAEHALKLVERSAAQRDIALALAPVPDPVPLVRTDRVPAVQALANLLGNAVRYSPPGSAVRLLVELDDASVHFHVEADAAQVPDAVRDEVFDAIQPGQTTLSGAESGSGMAFAIARSLVGGMGGSLSFLGAGEEGAVFTLTLPAA